MSNFSDRIVSWQQTSGRHHLPWQNTEDPYLIWLSEIMLQQTQVVTVIPYFERFVKRFPNVRDLAAASEEEVLSLWAGLGYYSRARNLHRCAKIVDVEYQGVFPGDATTLQSLPGIGRSTAAAIAAFSKGERAAILDGNVKRVLARHFAIGDDLSKRIHENSLWSLAESLLPDSTSSKQQHQFMRAYTQGLMDLGATLCKRSAPLCLSCPLVSTCQAYQLGKPTAFPFRKPKKTLPEREAVFLYLRQNQRVLLVQRPETGIWGGLWCLPEFETQEGLFDVFPFLSSLPTEEVTIQHRFSHYRLSMTVMLFDLRTGVEDSTVSVNGRWYDADTIQNVGLPKPIMNLIQF